MSPLPEIEHIEIEITNKSKEITNVEKVKEEEIIQNKEELSATFAELFQFSDLKDRLCISVGLFTAVLSGLNQPAQLIIFGSVLDAFNNSTPEESSKLVSFMALMYFVVGVQQFLTNFLQTALMNMAAGRQTKTLRQQYFLGILKQDITYFDKNDQGSLSTSVMESTLVVQDAMVSSYSS